MMDSEISFELPQDLLKNQIPPFQKIEKAHSNSIESAAPHPSNKSFATGSHDKTIKLWDLGKLKESATLSDHKQGVWSLQYSHNGKNLISASPDKSVLIWDTGKSSAGMKLLGHKDKVYIAKYNQSNKLIGSMGEGGELLIWDVAKTDKPLKSVDLKSMVGYDISWQGDMMFASAMGLRTLALNAQTFEIISDECMVPNYPDSKMLAVTSNWKTLQGKIFVAAQLGHIGWYEWKKNKMQKEIEFMAHNGGCRNVALHPHQKYLLSSGKDGSVRLWNCNSEGHPIIHSNLVFHDENVTTPIFLGDEHVVTVSWDQNIGIWKYSDIIA